MYKIGVIGDRESVLGYRALGFAVYEAADVETAKNILHRLGRDEQYAVIFIVEDYACRMEEEIAKYDGQPQPAVKCIPGREGTTGYGMANIRNAVERAVGADILFKDPS